MKGPFPYNKKNTQAAGKTETLSKVTGAHDIQKRHRDHRQRPSAWDESQNACIIQASGRVFKIGGSRGLISPTDLGFGFFFFLIFLDFFVVGIFGFFFGSFCFFFDFWDFLQKIQFQWIPKLRLKEMTSLGFFEFFCWMDWMETKRLALEKLLHVFLGWKNSKQHALEKLLKNRLFESFWSETPRFSRNEVPKPTPAKDVDFEWNINLQNPPSTFKTPPFTFQ